jgi:hypothetical protein
MRSLAISARNVEMSRCSAEATFPNAITADTVCFTTAVKKLIVWSVRGGKSVEFDRI